MDSLNPALVVTYFVGGLVALAVAAVLFRPLWLPLWHVFRRTQEFLEDWFGEPSRDGQPARPGAMARLAQLERNSGTSLRDAVDRIETQIGDARTEAVRAAELAQQAARMAGQAAANAATAEQRATERHVQNVERLDGLERERIASAWREQTYLASLHELGLDIDPGSTRTHVRPPEPD